MVFGSILLAAILPVAADAKGHAVTFTAIATGVATNTPVEFMFLAPGSEHEYEAMFTLEAPVADFAHAFDEAKIPRGRPLDAAGCILSPSGVKLTLEPALDAYLTGEVNGKGVPFAPLVYTGGARAADGSPLAATNAPNAAFSFYDLPQSLVLFDGNFPQGDVYGRYRPRVALKKGERLSFTFRWDGTNRPNRVTLEFSPSNQVACLKRMMEESEKTTTEVLASFAPELTLREAIGVAKALATVDSPRVRIIGRERLFFRAYLPLEQWRDRRERLTQPVEVHFNADGGFRYIEIDEDWNVEGSDPKLTEKCRRFADLAEVAAAVDRSANRSDTIFLYAAPETRLERLFALHDLIRRPITNWYVFTE